MRSKISSCQQLSVQKMKIEFHKILTYLIAAVWFINGFFCKVLNLVPRHEQIVARILGSEYSQTLTIMIGLAETAMAVWILTGFKSKLNSIVQITVVATMNVIEFNVVPDLLLWGRLNIVFAFLFIGIVYFNEFILTHKRAN